MADTTQSCPSCNAEVDASTAFCPECGAAMPDPAPQRPAKKIPARTMIGQPVDLDALAAAAPSPESAPPQHTAPENTAPENTAPEDTPPLDTPPLDTPAVGTGPEALKGRTMLGMSPALADDVKAAVAAAKKAKTAKTAKTAREQGDQSAPEGAAPEPYNPKRTLLGMSSHPPTASAPQSTDADAPDEQPAVEPAAQQAPSAITGAAAGRTMLGMPDDAPEASAAAQSGEASTARSHAANVDGSWSTADAPGSAPAATATTAGASTGIPRYSESLAPPPRSGGKVWWVVGLVAVVAAAAAVLLLAKAPETSSVQVDIIHRDGGEAMVFRTPEAAPGSKIIFGTLERDVTGGEVSFPLAVDSLKVGDNLVVAQLVSPEGEVEAIRIPLEVDYRIHADTSPLRTGKHEIDVVVSAVPGTKVTIDGEALSLDDEGRGIRPMPIDLVEEARRGTIEHVVKYRVEPPEGETVVSELRTRIPVTMMQLDSPGFEVTTDRSSIQLAGAVAKGTTVTLDGAPIEVNAQDRFLHELPLPEPGVYEPRVVASAPDRAPLALRLTITRVKDLKQAAKGFKADPKLTFAKISQNPTMYKGQKVAFEGRVFRAKTEGGRSVLQMLVRKCPKGMQCSLWVSFAATAEVMSDSWVRVLGTVEGIQQFRAQSGAVVSVPKVNATFVLPIRP